MGGGINIYAYVGDDPLRWYDPTGLIKIPDVPGAEGETSIHANPGPEATDFRAEHDPPHVHLGANDGPRVRTDTFEPLTPEDAKRMTRKQLRFCKALSDDSKKIIRLRQAQVFKYGRILTALLAAPPIALDSLTAACREDPFFCIDNTPGALDSFGDQHGLTTQEP